MQGPHGPVSPISQKLSFLFPDRMRSGAIQFFHSVMASSSLGKLSNYDTDIFSGTIETIEKITGSKYEGGEGKSDVAFRVLADHIRAISFTIADGQLPSNTGAGYVIRRILRRAVRYYYSYLNFQQPLLFQLVPVLAQQFERVFPEVKLQEAFVAKVIREEEEAFFKNSRERIEKNRGYHVVCVRKYVR